MDRENGGGAAGSGGQERSDDEGFDLSNPGRSFVSTVRKVLFEPAGFFRRLPTRGRALPPVLFAIVCNMISVPLALLVIPLDPLAGEEASTVLDPLAALVAEPGGSVAAVIVLVLSILILAPLFALLSLYIVTAIYHILVWIVVRPTETNFETTLRVVAYTSAVALVSWIPVIGLLASLYGLYLTIVGLREMHETTTVRAITVMLLPFVVLVALYLPALI